MRARDTLSGAGDTVDTLTEAQERVVSRVQRTVLAARKTIDSAIVAA